MRTLMWDVLTGMPLVWMGIIFINTDQELMSGDFVHARVTGALEYDLMGELCDEFTE